MTRAQEIERCAKALLARVEDDAFQPADEFTRVQRDALRAALSLPPEAAAPVAKSFDPVHDPIGVWGELRPDGTREVVLNEDGMRLFPGTTFVTVEPTTRVTTPVPPPREGG